MPSVEKAGPYSYLLPLLGPYLLQQTSYDRQFSYIIALAKISSSGRRPRKLCTRILDEFKSLNLIALG